MRLSRHVPMPSVRYLLMIVLIGFAYFDVREAFSVWMFGFPAMWDLLPASEAGEVIFPTPTVREQIMYGLYLGGLALVQVALVIVTWRVWRQSSHKLN